VPRQTNRMLMGATLFVALIAFSIDK